VSQSRGIWVIVLASVAALLLLVAPPKPETIKWIIAARFPSVSWVDADTLARWMGDDADGTLMLLDARTKEEYAVSHLRHATWVGPDGTELLESSLPDDAVVVVYCSVGYRSAAVAKKLRKRGAAPVYNLTGGIFGWANAGRPLFRDDTRVEEVHPYSEAWRWLVREDLRAR
jgi:rhodanese-related sulfurtransferase